MPSPLACFFCSSARSARRSRAARSAASARARAARTSSASRRATYSRARAFTSAISVATPTFAVASVLGGAWVPLPRAETAETAVGGSGSYGRASSFGTAVASAASRCDDRSSFERPVGAFAASRAASRSASASASASASRSLCPYVFSPSFGASARVYRRLASSRTASSAASSSLEKGDADPLDAARDPPVFAADAASSPPPLASASGSRGTASGAFACAVSALVMARRTEGRRALAAESKRNPDSALPRATPRFRTRADSPPVSTPAALRSRFRSVQARPRGSSRARARRPLGARGGVCGGEGEARGPLFVRAIAPTLSRMRHLANVLEALFSRSARPISSVATLGQTVARKRRCSPGGGSHTRGAGSESPRCGPEAPPRGPARAAVVFCARARDAQPRGVVHPAMAPAPGAESRLRRWRV